MENYDLIGLAKQIQSATPEYLNKRMMVIERKMETFLFTGKFPDPMCFIELTMISQRCMKLANVELTREERNDKEVNPVCWMVIPMGDDKKYWLNEHGRRIWECTSKIFNVPVITAERAYYWVDKVLILDMNRKVLKEMSFSEFIKTQADHYDPVMPEEEK